MKKVFAVILFFTFLYWISPVYVTSQTVSVKIAEFPVTLNGVPLNGDHYYWLSSFDINPPMIDIKYPLLVNNDIVYFPMTWYLSNLLNLDTTWGPVRGLEIKRRNPSEWKYFSLDWADSRNSINQYASIIDSPVTVNGKPIYNADEQYPLLLFRDVTYFPLTRRFAVDEFGWRYSYNQTDGLVVDSDNAFYYSEDVPATSAGPPLEDIFYNTYIRNNVKIWIEYRAEGHAIQYGKMFISQGGEAVEVGSGGLDRFGAFDPPPEVGRFYVEGDWVYTWYLDCRTGDLSDKLVPARVNINTKLIEIL